MSRSVLPPGYLPAILLFLGISLACTRIPLLDYLGYEFGFVTAIVGSLICGLTATGSFHRWLSRETETEMSGAGGEFRKTLSWNLALLIIPLVVITANALFVKNCSIPEGLTFFMLLPAVSVWFSVALAFFCSVHYRHPRLIFTALFVVSLAYAGACGYFTPAIYSYNFFYGFFPGFTYDELLEISPRLLFFRVITLVIGYLLYRAALLILEAGPVDRPTRRKGIDLIKSLIGPGNRRSTIAAGILLATLVAFRAQIGLESPASFIRSELGSSIMTPHFAIYYSDSTYNGEEVRWLAAEHEFRLTQLNRTLGSSLEGRIASFVYPSVESKRRYVGAGTTSIAKPWSGEIHLHAGGVADVLKHELVHLVVAPYGIPLLRASISPGLTEGLAMALERNWGNRTLHEYAAGMKQAGLVPDMVPIMGSVGLLRQASSVSYVLAGSFCGFLLDRYGIHAMTDVYGWGNYESALGKSLDVLLAEWEEMLATVPTDEGMRDVVDVYFRAAPIFGKTCARVTARKISEARRAFDARTYNLSATLYGEAFGESRSNEALGGLLVSELRVGKTDRLIAAGDSLRRLDTPGKLLPLYLPIGDAFWLEGRTEEAHGFYARVLSANLSRASAEAALVRIHAGKDSLAHLFRSYLLSDRPDSLRIVLLDTVLTADRDHPLGLYLRGKCLLRLGRFREALSDFDRADVSAIHTKLEAARRLARGDALFRLRRFNEARTSYTGALTADPSPGLEREVHEKAEQCDWYDRNGMPDALVADMEGEGR